MPSKKKRSLALIFNNNEFLGARSPRNVNQQQYRRQRIANKIHRRHVRFVNNTLDRIKSLPIQVTNDPLIHGFFNGSSFI